MIKKVISGFQSGADIGGVKAAKALGIETSGWMPKGFRTENGPRPEYAELYGAKEHVNSEYPPRTEQNVIDSDGTLLFGSTNSVGSRLTLKYCVSYLRPTLTIRNHWSNNIPEIYAIVRAWLDENSIEIVNIAGNRESVNPGIEKWTEDFMKEVLS